MEIGKGRTLTRSLEEIDAEILTNLDESLSHIENPVHLILHAHLYIEHLLDRFIMSELPNGSLIINNGYLSFKQKTLLAGTFTIVEEQIIDCIIKLNKLRNNLAHEFNHKITNEEVDLIGRPLGKDFTRIQKTANGCLLTKLFYIIHFVASCIATNTYISENSIYPSNEKNS